MRLVHVKQIIRPALLRSTNTHKTQISGSMLAQGSGGTIVWLIHNLDAMGAIATKLTGSNASSITALQLHGHDLPTTSEAERRSALLWWTYGLFSQDARHSIQRLNVPVLFCDGDDLRWLIELLHTQGAPRPELFVADAFDEFVDREAPTHDQWLLVPSGYPILEKLTVESQDGTTSLDSTVTFDQAMRFRVLRDDPRLPFVDILVPDYGHCRAERSGDIVTETTPFTKWRLDQHAIRAMDFELYEVDDYELWWVCELLKLFGAGLEEVCLWRRAPRHASDVQQGSVDSENLVALARSCPRLQKLTFEDVEVNGADLVGLYEVESCRIKTIELTGHHHTYCFGILTLMLALADHTKPITQTLEELTLDFTDASLAEKGERDLYMIPLFMMLRSNRILKKVDLHVHTSQLAQYEAEFREVRGKDVCVGAVPLSSSHKCAFLSVVSQKKLDGLESDALRSVFAFAAQRESRVLNIKESNHWTMASEFA